ncbi:helix-turn-helix domain-containing protein [Bacteroides sp.]
MTKTYQTKLKGILALTDSYHSEKGLQNEKSLYKFMWVRKGSITLEIDHQKVVLKESEILSLTNLQHLKFLSIDGDYMTLLFNGNFYCIYGNDHEVSCSGFLFNGSSHVVRFMLDETERQNMEDVLRLLEREFNVSDNLQEEMLRILLKRFIIQSTRIARHHLNITQDKEYGFEVIRQFYILVDEHFRTKKQVQDYADMLNKSPKTLSNIFSLCKQPSPLRVIHERIESEAKRLLLYSSKSSKEIADILGFEDQSTFSRFFKNMTGESPVQYRSSVERIDN